VVSNNSSSVDWILSLAVRVIDVSNEWYYIACIHFISIFIQLRFCSHRKPSAILKIKINQSTRGSFYFSVYIIVMSLFKKKNEIPFRGLYFVNSLQLAIERSFKFMTGAPSLSKRNALLCKGGWALTKYYGAFNWDVSVPEQKNIHSVFYHR